MEEQHDTNNTINQLKERALNRSYFEPSYSNWNMVPSETWNEIMQEIRRAFPATTIAIFILSVYDSALQVLASKKEFPRPPNGITLKHLCLLVLQGISKSYLRTVIQYVLTFCSSLISGCVHPRSAEETAKIADERLARSGMPFPCAEFKEIRHGSLSASPEDPLMKLMHSSGVITTPGAGTIMLMSATTHTRRSPSNLGRCRSPTLHFTT